MQRKSASSILLILTTLALNIQPSTAGSNSKVESPVVDTGQSKCYDIRFGRALSAWQWQGQPMNAHGAGAQRSDPKAGDPAGYSRGLGPQGDQIRIYNYARCVRNSGSKP